MASQVSVYDNEVLDEWRCLIEHFFLRQISAMILFRFAVSLLVILLLFFVSQISAAPEMYKLNPAQTHLHFAVSYLGFSTIYGCY
ncbi:hypothetical protein SAMN05216419_10493 [Nitrosomonas cryotolerans]|uniref:Uncharacterized protein n=1 Tax=Nitrosomonas cryotolerans ATCC 49181 TaxID=1131553 RepID=A0A1N6JJS1_9PROT|nr:hypothetical protein [Nitrosomonas cryotolerans]SFQ03423.1 hypothetical protein SAMN05216419_10493 [Nitrosomonas cryotolerans]SIO44618.1 hypothetical protein SAMN02743940_2680 [Nitrosomonas cryotolerans ATCC 49181]